jgi:hypothetical protein
MAPSTAKSRYTSVLVVVVHFLALFGVLIPFAFSTPVGNPKPPRLGNDEEVAGDDTVLGQGVPLVSVFYRHAH